MTTTATADAIKAATTTTAAPPSTSSTQSSINSGAASLSSSYSTFLTLLTTQLKNQDPTSPMDTNQFTQQLVAMTGVQQQLLSNQLLQQLVSAGSGAQAVTSSVGLIGKTVTAASGDAVLTGGAANFGYNLPTAASGATLSIKDSTGSVVWTGSAPDLSAGAHSFSWNGKTTSGAQRGDGGTYTMSIAAKDTSGVAITATPVITGVVTGILTSGTTTEVKIGSSLAPVSSITSVIS